MQAQQCTDPIAYHAEGPVWSASWGGLAWVDMLAGDILGLTADGEMTRRNVGTIAAAIRPRRAGGAVIGVERGFRIEDANGSAIQLLEVWQDNRIRMNEGGCDPDGRFYCGSMAYDQRPGAATVYRLGTDYSVEPVIEDVTIANGLEWSPDGSLAYFNDTATHKIDVFDYDSETGLTNRRVFVQLDDTDAPDGLTVDAQGYVWTAINGAGQVRRYSPAGQLDGVVNVAARQVTACTFGGPNLDRLFITTSRENLADDDDPLAGSLFTADVGVTGLPVREFAG